MRTQPRSSQFAGRALAACGGNGGDEAATIPVGTVDPGTYKSEPSEPALRLIDEQGWRALFAPEDDELAFEHEDGRFLAFTRVTRVVDPRTGRDVPAPTDLVGGCASIRRCNQRRLYPPPL